MRKAVPQTDGKADTVEQKEPGELWSSLLQNKDYKSGIEKIPNSSSPAHRAPLSGALAWGRSDAKVPGQEGAVPGRRERQVGTPCLVQNVERVGQRTWVKALFCHSNLLLLEGLCGGQGLLGKGRSEEAEGRGILPQQFRGTA